MRQETSRSGCSAAKLRAGGVREALATLVLVEIEILEIPVARMSATVLTSSPDSMPLSMQRRIRVVATILVGLVIGGVAGAGVAYGWYGPAVGVGVAAIVGFVVGRQVFVAAREARRSPED